MSDFIKSPRGCWRVVMITCMACGLWAREVTTDQTWLPATMRDDVEAMMWINDPAWLFNQMDAFVGVAGHPAQRLRSLAREAFLLSASREGIDLERPAFLAWRRGAAPLIAVLPVADRRIFLREFGKVMLLDRQMIRINEQAGTIVYSQNTQEGLWEYRLMVHGEYAYLARSADECRALSAMIKPTLDEDVPLALWTQGDYVLRTFGDQVDALCDHVATRWIQDCVVFSHMIGDLRQRSSHIAGIDLSLVRENEDHIVARLVMRSRPDSPFAQWVARQRARSSRLLGVVARDDDLVQMHGALQWQGEIEDFGRRFVAALREHDDVTIDSERTSVLRGFFNLLDRRAAFAMAWHPPMGGQADAGPTLRAVSEQQLSTEYLRGQRAIDQVLQVVDGRSVGALDLLAGQVSYRYPLSRDRGHVVKVGLSRHLVEVVAPHSAVAEVEARTMMTILEEDHPPRGATAIVAVRVFLDRVLAYRFGPLVADTHRRNPVLDMVVRSAPGQGLMLETRLPMTALRETLRDASLDASRTGD